MEYSGIISNPKMERDSAHATLYLVFAVIQTNELTTIVLGLVNDSVIIFFCLCSEHISPYDIPICLS